MDVLAIRGARQNNLRAVDLDLPLRAAIAFTGPSGSGKSSLAFDTLHEEGQRRYLEALSAHRPGMRMRAPAVDLIRGLPPTIALDQHPTTPSRRSTVATFAELHPLLRLLFARAGTQHCPDCGTAVRARTHDEIVAVLMAHPQGSRLTIEAPLRPSEDTSPAALLAEIARAGFSRVRVGSEIRRLEDVRPADVGAELHVVVDRIKIESERRDRVHDAVRTASRAGRGVIVADVDGALLHLVDRPYCWVSDRVLPALEPGLFSFNQPTGRCPTCLGLGVDETTGATCAACGGSRLREEARAVRWQDTTLPDLAALDVATLRDRAGAWSPDPVTDVAVDELRRRLELLVGLGLGRIGLDRVTSTLSTGEHQRLRLAAQVGARLSGVLYVLDEPTAGLDADQVDAVLGTIRDLRDAGNTVLVVTHEPGVVRAVDHVVDFGPGPGAQGGRVVFEGTPADLLAADTLTGRWLSGRASLPARERRSPSGTARVADRELPLGVLLAVTGPSGSGKTRLLDAAATEAAHDPDLRRVVEVTSASLGRGQRATPATYSGAWDVVRSLLAATHEARVRGMEANFFSLNVAGGRCEVCKGTGQQCVDLEWLPEVWLPCDVCEGRRFNADVLHVRWKGRNAAELLDLSVDDAHALLAGHPKLETALRSLRDVGLGYVQLGQPAHTLSGGEAQRLKLARELAKAAGGAGTGVVYVLDQPTIGLHPADTAALVRLLWKLVDEGATVWAATHDPAVVAAADVTWTL